MDFWREFPADNAGYVAHLYERFLRDPQSVDPAARQLFEHWAPPDGATSLGAPPSAAPALEIDKIVGAANLAQAIRAIGHLAARLDPLGGPPPGDPALLPETYGLNSDDLRQLPARLVGGPLAAQGANALEALEALRAIYSGAIGYDVDVQPQPPQTSIQPAGGPVACWSAD